MAAEANEPFSIAYFVEKGVDINLADIHNRTPLHHAALNVQQDAIDYIIAYGANVNAVDSSGRTPLHYAVQLYSRTSDIYCV